MSAQDTQVGRVVGVNGPIVQAEGMAGVGAFEVVRLGPKGLIGEVTKLAGDRLTMQVYEYTGGLRPGDEVRATGGPLAVTLGPGLLGNIYDGLQRPLRLLAEREGGFLSVGAAAEAVDKEKEWSFSPCIQEGQEAQQGDVFGTVQETPALEHRLMIPPHLSGEVVEIQPEGDYPATETLCVVENEKGRHGLNMLREWPVRRPRPFGRRETSSAVMATGQRIIDTFFPLARGGAAAVPGDFGTGKTVLQQQFAKWSDADVVIYVGCGERGNEMTDVLRTLPELEDPRTGRTLMERTILVANTSNMPVAAREVSIYTGITLAEYYRDMGYAVALMADSTSRWAEALREASSRQEEMPAEEGYPAYLSSRLAEFYERAGLVETLGGREGSVTVIGSVSPPGGDFSEPVTMHTTRFVRCFLALDQDLAYSRHYPAVNWLDSYSEYLEDVGPWWEEYNPDWGAQRGRMMDLLSEEDELQDIVQLVGRDVLPDNQRLTLLVADLLKTGFLQQDATDPVDTYCEPEKQAKLLKIFIAFLRRTRDIVQTGAPIARVRELDVVPELRRAKLLEELDELDELHQRMDQQLSELEKQYG